MSRCCFRWPSVAGGGAMLLLVLMLTGCETMKALGEKTKEVMAKIGQTIDQGLSSEEEQAEETPAEKEPAEKAQEAPPAPEKVAKEEPAEAQKPQLLMAPPATPPLLDVLEADYVAVKASNVRIGPGVRYVVVDRLNRGQRVRVKGKVRGRNWYAFEREGGGVGYVYASLLKPAPTGVASTVRHQVTPPLPEGELGEQQIRRLLIGHTVRLEGVVGDRITIEYYDAAEGVLKHFENGVTTSGKWRIQTGEHSRFCRYWQVGERKKGRCYSVLSKEGRLIMRPVTSLSAFARLKRITRRQEGDHFDAMIQEVEKTPSGE